MKIFSIRSLRLLVSVVLFLLFLFANFFVIRQIMRDGSRAYFYDKMLTAYQIGGESGLTRELELVLQDKRMPVQVKLAKDFKVKLKELNNPGMFLRDTSECLRERVVLLRNLRNAAFILIFILLLLRLFIDYRSKKNKPAHKKC